MIDLVVNRNSYLSIDEADAILGASIRSALKWSTLSDTDKAAALITAFNMLESQTWQGSKTGYLNVASATTDDEGTNYVAGDDVEVVGGDAAAAATFDVTEVDGFGGAATITPTNAGLYTAVPDNPAATALTGSGLGADLTLTLTTESQVASWPRTGVVDRYGTAVDSTATPAAIARAQALLAYELTQNPDLETVRDANGNVQSYKAGSVGITYFSPVTNAGRFPANVQELIREFLASGAASSGGTGGSYSTGTGACSEFAEKRYGLSGPL